VIGRTASTEADKLVGDCIDAGVNFFDTANVYAIGESETMLAKALGARRKDVVIASKVFGRMAKAPTKWGFRDCTSCRPSKAASPEWNTDCIDLYQIHGFDSVTPLEENPRALNDLVRQARCAMSGARILRRAKS